MQRKELIKYIKSISKEIALDLDLVFVGIEGAPFVYGKNADLVFKKPNGHLIKVPIPYRKTYDFCTYIEDELRRLHAISRGYVVT